MIIFYYSILLQAADYSQQLCCIYSTDVLTKVNRYRQNVFLSASHRNNS